MYKNKYISELPINEVKEYFDELRCKYPLTAEKSADYAICKERLVVYACKTLEKINVLDEITGELKSVKEKWWYGVDNDCFMKLSDVLQIIDKYRKESEE